MRSISAVCAVALCCLLASRQAAGDGEPRNRPIDVPRPERDILYLDAKWCAPRILYFFSWYLRNESLALDEVVELCEADKDGNTSLLDLVRAADGLELSPLPVRCMSDEVLESGGPAIICFVPTNSRSAGRRSPDTRISYTLLACYAPLAAKCFGLSIHR